MPKVPAAVAAMLEGLRPHRAICRGGMHGYDRGSDKVFFSVPASILIGDLHDDDLAQRELAARDAAGEFATYVVGLLCPPLASRKPPRKRARR